MSSFINFFLLLSIVFSYNSDEEILVKIDNKIITKNEFIKRAEYTIRPPYCRSDNYIHKKIILNSLIAEKLLALEIENKVSIDQLNNDFINGIKEQTMRETMLNKEIYNNIKIDSKGNRKFRMVTHFGFTKNDVNTVIEKIKKIFNNYV